MLRILRSEKHLWQFSLKCRLHSYLNLRMKQTKTHKKKNWLTLGVRTCKTLAWDQAPDWGKN